MPKASNPTPSSQSEAVVKLLTARDVTLQSLMKYCDQRERHVKSSSLHNLWFADDIKEWKSFEDEVASLFAKIPWDKHQEIIAYGLPKAGISENHLDAREHFVCGEELSISGRWVQHALHPMSAVSKVLKFNMVFGDWKATSKHGIDFVQTGKVDDVTGKIIKLEETEASTNKGKGRAEDASTASNVDEGPTKGRAKKSLVPDYALMMEVDGAPRAVGEAKTPWNHDFIDMWTKFIDSEDRLLMRQALGQIGSYMIELELKYGFLTNYDHTFFLKREGEKGKELIYCSKPIPYSASPSEGGKISVRQGLLFMQHSVLGKAWYAKKISETSIVKKKRARRSSRLYRGWWAQSRRILKNWPMDSQEWVYKNLELEAVLAFPNL